jgi:hypothetical protein
MRALSRRLLSALILAGSVGVSSGSGASILTLAGATLGIGIGSLFPPVVFPQNNTGVAVSVSSGGGSFTEPAGIFTGNVVALPTSLFTGVPLVHQVFLGNLSNGTKFVAQGAAGGGHTANVLRAGGGLGGPGPLTGTAFINVLGLSNLAVPLFVIGNTGAETAVNFGESFLVTVNGTGWTTGPVTLTGLTVSGVNTVTLAGYDNRTPAHDGVVQLVSPFKVTTNAIGNLPGLAVQTLSFSGAVPEPGTLALLGLGAAALATLGWRRGRH